MPVEYCTQCGSVRSMQLAVSRVRVLSRSGKTDEITTRTLLCRTCGSLVLGNESEGKSSLRTGSRKQPDDRPRKRACLARRNKARQPATGLKSALILILFLIFVSCQTVPITERRQLSLIPTETILPLSFGQYREFLAKNKVVENTPEAEMVKRVGVRIQRAVERYFAENNLAGELEGYAWEFNLIDDKSVNAWAMPGGKVVVYTGILPVTGDENGLAVVMGHEVAHAVANHGDERMSQGLLAQMGGMALSAALAQKPRETNNLFLAAYGLGAQVGVLLPFSRLQESEADHLGLVFMAMAGYDPRGAVEFWKRMAEAKEGPAPPEFLSTHPADEKRIEKIRELLPEAIKYYKT